jgi:hypothetical protein
MRIHNYSIGKYYIWQNGEKYQKVMITDIMVSVTEVDDAFFEEVLIECAMVKNDGQPWKNFRTSLGNFKAKTVMRDPQPYCWNCNHSFNEVQDDICEVCGWISCPHDKACGCNYPYSLKKE